MGGEIANGLLKRKEYAFGDGSSGGKVRIENGRLTPSTGRVSSVRRTTVAVQDRRDNYES